MRLKSDGGRHVGPRHALHNVGTRIVLAMMINASHAVRMHAEKMINISATLASDALYARADMDHITGENCHLKTNMLVMFAGEKTVSTCSMLRHTN